MGRSSGRTAVSLIELLFALLLGSIVLYTAYQLLGAGRRMEAGVGAHLSLQADARKALISLIKDLQEGIYVVKPSPGQTLSYALVRDKLNRFATYRLIPGTEGKDHTLIRELSSATKSDRHPMMQGVTRLTFTALTDQALMIHLVLGAGEREFALHTEIRLRNRAAADGVKP